MIVAGMATMPSRIATAPQAIASILPQVDRLWLCLDGFEAVPDFAIHPKITYQFGRDHGGLKAEGKFLGLTLDDQAEVYVTVDDDILYPANYVERLLFFRKLLPGRVAVGCHGSVFRPPIRSYAKDRKVWTARRRQLLPWRTVDVLATNGSLHLVRDLKFDPRAWQHRNQVDLNFLEEAIEAGVRFALPPRPRNWVHALETRQKDSIYVKLLKDDGVQSSRVNDVLRRRGQKQNRST